MKFSFPEAKWIYQPKFYIISDNSVTVRTDPKTDFWQRTYYGFKNDNAPALLVETKENFSFTAKTSFTYKKLFDQCGLIIYLDSENWFKASIEYDNECNSKLGSVVTNNGYSDWATTDITTPKEMWYRLSRRGPDFLVECSPDGLNFRQMRIFHLNKLGETCPESAKEHHYPETSEIISFGLYACSPLDSSFDAVFSDFRYEQCLWQPHK